MTAWPRMMKRDKAAAYCDMSQPAFEREINAGRLPPPGMLGGAAIVKLAAHRKKSA